MWSSQVPCAFVWEWLHLHRKLSSTLAVMARSLSLLEHAGRSAQTTAFTCYYLTADTMHPHTSGRQDRWRISAGQRERRETRDGRQQDGVRTVQKHPSFSPQGLRVIESWEGLRFSADKSLCYGSSVSAKLRAKSPKLSFSSLLKKENTLIRFREGSRCKKSLDF